MLHHMLYSDMKIIYDIIYDIISYVVYYIIYELTVHGTDRNPSFDECGVDIQHNGDRNLAAAMRLEASSAAVRLLTGSHARPVRQFRPGPAAGNLN